MSLAPAVLSRVCRPIAAFSGPPGKAGTPAGSRPEGRLFESSVQEAWVNYVIEEASSDQHLACLSRSPGVPRPLIAISNASTRCSIYLGATAKMLNALAGRIPSGEDLDLPQSWLKRGFLVKTLIENHLGVGVPYFAPKSHDDSLLYFGERYPKLYEGKTTVFDFTAALVKDGTLVEKMLFECKYAKDKGDGTVEGNAHERLGFQMLQYLEVAQMYSRCSLNVIVANAFLQCRNKYHPGFNQQAKRLGDCFSHFIMRFCACLSDYVKLFSEVSAFLHTGKPPKRWH